MLVVRHEGGCDHRIKTLTLFLTEAVGFTSTVGFKSRSQLAHALLDDGKIFEGKPV